MNERIRKLALQAGAQGIVNRDFIDIEKFAELIVRECIDIIDEEGSHEGGSIRSMEKIREHFGVE